MTTCTPIYQLPYPVGSDRPCDTGVWCNYATAVETQLDALDAIVDRTIDTVPMAIVTLTTPTTTPALSTAIQVPWDTVNVDTADMIDLVGNPYAITLPRYGRYWVSFGLQLNNVPASASMSMQLSSINAILPPAYSSIIGPLCSSYNDGVSVSYMSAAAEIRFASTQGVAPLYGNLSGTPGVTGFSLTVNVFGASTIPSATMSAIWIGDLA